MVWLSWITVWDSHFRQGNSVKHLSAFEPTIINGKTFSTSWSNSKLPTLPFNFTIFNSERRSLWLRNQQWFDISSYCFTIQVWMILPTWNFLPWSSRGSCLIKSTWQVIHPDKFLGESFKHWRKFQWQGIVVGFTMSINGLFSFGSSVA